MQELVENIVEDVTGGMVSNVTANVGARFSSARAGGSAPTATAGLATLKNTVATLAKRDRRNEASPGVGEADWDAPRGLDLSRLFGSGAFEVALGAAEGEAQGGSPGVTLWGRGDVLFFENDAASSGYDGNLKAGYLGVDAWLDDRWLAGVAASRSAVKADYSLAGTEAGELRLDLTGVHPYVRYAHGEGGEAWAILGAGTGEIKNRPAGGGAAAASDVKMFMAAAGLRQAVRTEGDVDVALLADAGAGRLKSDSGSAAVPRAIDSLSVNSQRARIGAEISRPTPLEAGDSVTPFLEVAGRYDGGGDDGDAGIEVSGGVLYADPAAGFGVEARGRALALYSGGDYREYGASVTASLAPGAGGEGLSLSLSPRFGANPAAGDTLWRDDPFALARADRRDRAFALGAAAGYGLPVASLRGVVTPFGEIDLRGGGSQRLRSGVRFARPGAPGALNVELAGERFAGAGGAPEHRVVLTGRARF